MSNKNAFDTTYRKVHGSYTVGYDADTDTWNIPHVDQNGHSYAKLLGEYNSAAIGLEANASGELKVDGSGVTLTVKQDAIVSTANSSIAPLNAGVTFTGEFVDLLYYATVHNVVKSDVSGTLYLDWSIDGVNTTRLGTVPITGGATAAVFFSAPRARYVRIRYTNGAVNQATFVLQTILHTVEMGATHGQLGYTGSDSTTALWTKAAITGKRRDTGIYDNVAMDDGSNLAVTMIQSVDADSNNSSTTNLGGCASQWDVGTAYVALDLVHWAGERWKCILAGGIGVAPDAPTGSTYWVEYTTPAEWIAGTAYVTNNLVTYGGKAWKALQNSTGQTPAENAYWTVYNDHEFVGTKSSTLGVAGIQVSLKTDVCCTVFVDQSPDGTNWDIVDEYDYPAGSDQFSRTVQAVNSYVRVRVHSEDPSPTTYFRLQTALCPVVEALPRSLDEEGSLKVCLTGLQDEFGFSGQFTPLHALQVCEPYRLVGSSFRSAVDTNFWTLTNNGAGSAAAVAYIATLTSGTANAGYGQITSVQNARFLIANPNLFRCVARIPILVAANNVRRWGAFTVSGQTPQDGFYFEISAAGVLSVNTVKGGVVTSVASESFNGAVNMYYMDTNKHDYDIIFLPAEAHFYIDDILIHSFFPKTVPMTNTFTLPASATSINTADAAVGGVLELWAAAILRLGRENSSSIYYHISGNAATHTLKIGAGRLHKIIFNNTSGTSITIYDNTAGSGTVIGIITTASAALGAWDFNVPFNTGLVLVTAGNGLDATVVYE